MEEGRGGKGYPVVGEESPDGGEEGHGRREEWERIASGRGSDS